MARTRTARRSRTAGDDPRVARHQIPARRLLTITPDSPVWDARGPRLPTELDGAMVRLQPPADASPDLIEAVRSIVAGVALGVRVMPKAAGHVAQAPATAPSTVKGAQGSLSIRQRALRRAGALKGARDIPALKAAVDQSLTAAGL